MARFVSLYSGSSGNAFYVGGKDSGVLVDVGVSFKSLCDALISVDIPLENIKALFVTHEHSDHIKGIDTFLKHHPVPVYASKETVSYIIQNVDIPTSSTFIELSQHGVDAADMFVTPFDTPHDSLHSLGFKFHTSDDRTVALATDLGHINENILKNLCSNDLVVIESNYDCDMLKYGPYPYYLKKRISSPIGHLSNTDCSSSFSSLIYSGVTRISLVHLSEKNNRPEIALAYADSALSEIGCKRGRDCIIDIAPRFQPGKMMIF